MQCRLKSRLGPLRILVLGLALMLLLMLACSTAATATPQPTEISGVVATPAKAAAAPTPATTPPVSGVNPGKLTWMIAGWGNERFDAAFFVGGNNNYMRLMQALPIATNEKSELIPGIATKWEISSDGKTWTVTIRKGVKFHNGQELTAEDVLWTWQHLWSKEAAAYATSIGSQTNSRIWEKAELTGLDKVSITHTTPNSAFMFQELSEVGPNTYAVIPKRDTLHNEAVEAAFDKNPIGTGAMKLLRHVPASVMEFERFEDFYYQLTYGLPEDRRVRFKSFELRLVPEEATRVAAMRAGEADVAPVSLAAKGQVEAGGGRLVFGREGVAFVGFSAVCWAKPEAPCNDKRVRQALDYAIDKELMMERLYGGATVAQAKAWGNITPGTIGYSSELDPWPFNPNKARQLLAEAGYPGGIGFGKLIVNTWVSTSLPLLPESAQLVADFWKRELGIDVEVKVGDEAALKKAWLSQEINGQFLWRDNEARLDAAAWAISFYGTPDQPNRFHNDPQLFELVKKTVAIFDPAERSKALNSLYQRLRDESYELGIGYVNIPWAVGSRIGTWEPYPLSFYPSALHTITLK